MAVNLPHPSQDTSHLSTLFSRLPVRLSSCAAALAAIFALASCGAVANLHTKFTEKKRKKAAFELAKASAEEAKGRLGNEALGEISYVDEESGFVLIRQLVGKRISAGMPLIAKSGAGGIASLKTSPAAKGSFIAADILKGTPKKGDSVMADAAAIQNPKPREPMQEYAGAPDGATAGSLDTHGNPNSAATASATAPNAGRRPRLDPVLPPLDPLKPPSDDDEGAPAEPPLPR